MVMKGTIHGRISPKGEHDVEHPLTTRTDTPSPPQAPSGPMTRARAPTIENEVDSLLFESRLDSCENWILPSSETLCVLRYQEDDREKERKETRATTEQGKEEKMMRT